MRVWCVLCVVLLFPVCVQAQIGHFIGLHKEDVVSKMQDNMPEMTQVKVVNPNFSYLKFQDAMGEQTILFFLDEKDVCAGHRFMSHYISLGEEVTRLNNEYNSAGEGVWTYSKGGQDYVVELKKEQWYFTLYTKKAD